MLHGKIRREYLFVDTLSKQVPINPRQKTQVTHVLITSAKPKVVVATQLSKTLNFFHHHEPVRCIIVVFPSGRNSVQTDPDLRFPEATRCRTCSHVFSSPDNQTDEERNCAAWDRTKCVPASGRIMFSSENASSTNETALDWQKQHDSTTLRVHACTSADRIWGQQALHHCIREA